jgi:transcription elongation GreA/GreB family factor
MNKAFTKEEDGSSPQRLPDLPVSSHPNHVTPRGLRLLQERKATLEAEVSRLRENRDYLPDPYPLDLRYVEARLTSAILVEPPQCAPEHVSFGATVLVEDEDGRQHRYTIVGEDEAEPEKGLITHISPLARALLEAKRGDIVEWPKPTGSVELEVLDISFDAA